MKLYHLYRRDIAPATYDEYLAFVIRARNEDEARSLLSTLDQGTWNNPIQTACDEIGVAIPPLTPAIVLESHL